MGLGQFITDIVALLAGIDDPLFSSLLTQALNSFLQGEQCKKARPLVVLVFVLD